MKLSAIASRGAAKDFWDLDLILRNDGSFGSLVELFRRYRQKYPAEDIGHVVRSLVYFGDANAQPLPAGMSHNKWAEIQEAFIERVKDFTKNADS